MKVDEDGIAHPDQSLLEIELDDPRIKAEIERASSRRRTVIREVIVLLFCAVVGGAAVALKNLIF